jgi:hypothetical protein
LDKEKNASDKNLLASQKFLLEPIQPLIEGIALRQSSTIHYPFCKEKVYQDRWIKSTKNSGFCQLLKKSCENYLFEDYLLKACIKGGFSEFGISGRRTQGDYPKIGRNFSVS